MGYACSPLWQICDISCFLLFLISLKRFSSAPQKNHSLCIYQSVSGIWRDPKLQGLKCGSSFFPLVKALFIFFFFGFAPFSFPWGLEIRVRKKTEKKKILRQKWKSQWCFTCKGLKKHLHKKNQKGLSVKYFHKKVIVGYYFVSLTVFYFYCFYAVVFILFLGKTWHKKRDWKSVTY